MVRTSSRLPALAAALLLAACGSSRPVEEGAGGPHPAGFGDPAVHGPAAFADLTSCQSCHGADYGGALGPSCNDCHAQAGYSNWTQNCTFCHGTEQVQNYTAADLPKAAPATGGHPGHSAVNMDCAECHAPVTSLDHMDGVTTVPFGALARTGGLNPAWASPTCSSVYCHGVGIQNGGGTSTTPTWVAGTVQCGACHALPPPTSDPAFPNNGHPFHVGIGAACTACHAGTTHVNGLSEYKAVIGGAVKSDGWNCASCHDG